MPKHLDNRGGPRHTIKPQVDEGLLLKVFSLHQDLLQDFGVYEHISKSQAVNPKGLFKLLSLTKGLLELEPQAEIHSQCLRNSIFQVLLKEPSLNDTKFSGSVWVGLRVERIGVHEEASCF